MRVSDFDLGKNLIYAINGLTSDCYKVFEWEQRRSIRTKDPLRECMNVGIIEQWLVDTFDRKLNTFQQILCNCS